MTGSQRAVGPTLRRLAPYVYLFVIAMLAAGVHIARYTELSPIDELRHLDYSMRASSFELPKLGDLLSQDAMRVEACRGIDRVIEWTDPPCDSKVFDPVRFRDDGYQTASPHPPTYYLGAGWFARAAEAIGLSDSFVDPARVFSALLFAAGLMAAFAAGRMARVRAAPLLAALTFVPVMPAALHASSTVNPDSTAILVGALVMLIGLAWERGRLPLWTLAVAGVLAGGTKVTSLLAVAVMAGLFLVRARPVTLARTWSARRRAANANETDSAPPYPPADDDISPRRPLEYAMALPVMVGSGLLVSGVWITFDRMRATIDPILVPQKQFLASHGIPGPFIVFAPSNVFSWLPPWNGYDPVRFTSPYVLDVRNLMMFVFAGAVLMAALQVNRGNALTIFAFGCVVAALVGGPTFVVMNAAISDVLAGPEARYGLSLVPFIVAIAASFARNKIGTTLLWIASLTSLAVIVGTMLVH